MWIRGRLFAARCWMVWYHAKHSLWALIAVSCAVGCLLGFNLKILAANWHGAVLLWQCVQRSIGGSP